jgi:hypothetical protein
MIATSAKDIASITRFLKLIASPGDGNGKKPMTSNDKTMMPRIRDQ